MAESALGKEPASRQDGDPLALVEDVIKVALRDAVAALRERGASDTAIVGAVIARRHQIAAELMGQVVLGEPSGPGDGIDARTVNLANS